MRPIFITKSAFEEYERIENKTKDEIRIKIMEMIEKLDFEDENEKSFYEIKCSKSGARKDELIILHKEMTDRTILFSSIEGDDL